MARMFMGFTRESIKRFENTLDYMQLSPKAKEAIMIKVLRRLKDRAKKNVSSQKTPDGKPWEPRRKAVKGGKRAQKMLKKGAQYLSTKIEQLGEVGRMNYTQPRTGRIFAEHHHGAEIKTKDDAAGKYKSAKRIAEERKEQATPKQIKRLKELGYTVSGKTKTGRKKQLKPNRNNINKAQAGIIIRYLEKKNGISRKGNKFTQLPKRPFLDTDQKRNADIITQVLFEAFEKKLKKAT